MEHSIGAVICSLRRKKQMTQEQLAQAVGVSASAVSKWERDAGCPDIALLSPIARALDTDVNSLLSFTSSCPEEALAPLLQKLQQTPEWAEALSQMRNLIRRYPGDMALLFQLASMAIGLAGFNGWSGEEQAQARLFAEKALEQVRQSGDAKLWPSAAHTLAALRMEAGELEQAEALLDTLPAMAPCPQPLYAALYRRQGKIEKAQTVLRGQLLLSTQTLFSLLGMLCTPEYARDESEACQALSAYRAISDALGFSPISGEIIAVTGALRAGRTEAALDALPALAREAVSGPVPQLLWVKTPTNAREYHAKMGQAIRCGLLADTEFLPLRKDRRYLEALRILEEAL